MYPVRILGYVLVLPTEHFRDFSAFPDKQRFNTLRAYVIRPPPSESSPPHHSLTERRGRVVNRPALCSGSHCFKSRTRQPYILVDVLHRLPETFEANSE
jgi:hypothetical protein